MVPAGGVEPHPLEDMSFGFLAQDCWLIFGTEHQSGVQVQDSLNGL